MANSTHVITDMSTVVSNGPSAATSSKAAGTADEMDYIGNTNLLRDEFKRIANLLTLVINVTDASDPSLTTLNNILATFS
ncbi:MAG: hypothetical protein KGI50_07525 [Patescibacteria group bacterium]|nr:hypothetical protein [Patescibacteria group bacterium]MDE2438940.1 hypothetical protein [Patescibacteria group bacterium]